MVQTLVRGIPAELRKHIYVNLRADSRYSDIREKLLEYEGSTQAWTSTNFLAGLNMDRPNTTTSDEYPQPMEIDMVWKGKGKGKSKGGKPKGQKGGGKGPPGKGPLKGFGRGRGKGDKGKGKRAYSKGGKAKGKVNAVQGTGKGKNKLDHATSVETWDT